MNPRTKKIVEVIKGACSFCGRNKWSFFYYVNDTRSFHDKRKCKNKLCSTKSIFSEVSCWSVVSKKIASSCAMPVDSLLTSIGFVGLSSPVCRIFSLGSIFEWDRKSCSSVHFPWNMCNVKMKLQYESEAIN